MATAAHTIDLRAFYADEPLTTHDNWVYRDRRTDTDDVTAFIAHTPDAEHQARVHARDTLYQRRVITTRPGERVVEITRHLITSIRDTPTGYVLETDADVELHAADIVPALADPADRSWSTGTPEVPRGPIDDGQNTWLVVEDVTTDTYTDIPAPQRCGDMTFEKLDGRGSRAEMNAFLEGGADGLVDHSLGRVQGWKASFVARYDGHIIAAIVLTNSRNPAVAAEGREVNIARLACHPVRPHNTASWMIARARSWAADAGYEVISAHAGVGDNAGVCYKAAGFHVDEDRSGWADGAAWSSRDGRREYQDGEQWYRQKWVYELTEGH